MQLTSEQTIFVVTNYLRTRSFNEVQQLFVQRSRDRVSSTKMTIWRNVEKRKTEGPGLSLNKDRSSQLFEIIITLENRRFRSQITDTASIL